MKKRYWFLLPRALILSILLYFVIFELVTSLFFSVNLVTSTSMLPDIRPSDRLVINRIHFGIGLPFSNVYLSGSRLPERGDVVVLSFPVRERRSVPVLSDFWNFISLNTPLFAAQREFGQGNGEIIRRVVAVAGDTVYMEGGRAFVRVAAGEGSSADVAGEGLEGGFVPEEDLVADLALRLPEGDFAQAGSLLPAYTGSITLGEGEVFVLPDNRAAAFGSAIWGAVPLERLRGRMVRRIRF